MNFKISKGDISDLGKIVELNTGIFDGMYQDSVYSLEDYKNKLDGVKPVIYLAMDRKKLIGDAVAFKRDDALYLWILGVDKKFRGRGIGNCLIKKMEMHAMEYDLNKIRTKVYPVSNDMLKLVEDRGYVGVEKSPRGATYFELKL